MSHFESLLIINKIYAVSINSNFNQQPSPMYVEKYTEPPPAEATAERTKCKVCLDN